MTKNNNLSCSFYQIDIDNISLSYFNISFIDLCMFIAVIPMLCNIY